MIEQSFSEVFASALGGAPTVVVGLGDEPMALPVHLWSRAADDSDHELVALCDGPTLDIGCGPGRLTEALVEHGHLALGIDVVPTAVAMTVDRGVAAMLRDVFDRLPGEGRWHSALLADGNIGIGGDPVRLLQRVRAVVVPGGRVVVELDGPGSAVMSCWAALEGSHTRSRPFRWATLGVDDVRRVAAAAGFDGVRVHHLGQRWAAVLTEGAA
ncbi:class I SAM-dependent methyltransferase [Nocardioides glacieisoli]|nr:class I SAM-dependent methyltransferase [Nocardioides glacieisoli]